MDRATLQVAARSSPDEGLILSVGGYLDEIGALSLAHETRSAPVDGPRHVRIDLGKVCLFNCSGARQLLILVDDLERLGYEVELVGVHPPLQRILDLSA